ncbi:MAG: putative zinc-binding protein [Thermoguttaceae bacterium]
MAETESKPMASCACGTAPKLIFSCSGAADVGHIADLAARKLSREGSGKMFCLAGIGGEVSGILETTRAASMVLAIDGCPLNCARRSLEKAGFSDFRHIQLADLGLAKGQSPVSDEAVARVASAATGLLAAG